MNKVFLGLGTNLGDRLKNLEEAISMTGKYIGTVQNVSSVYETSPWGYEDGNDFLNMVIEVSTSHLPADLMKMVLKIESLMGRTRNGRGYSSRIIDIDILFYNDMVIHMDDIIIPHALMHARKFVLVPFCELAPGLVHPVMNKSVSDLLRDCPDKSRISKV